MEFENKKLRDVADVAARIMMGEKALHPNQQKLDVHEPEKDELTADDFKKLRAGKKAPEVKKEEVEQIDEVSLKTATSAYVKRMGDDGPDEKSSQDKAVKTMDHIAKKHGVKGVARAAKTADDKYGLNDPVHNPRKAFVKQVMAGVKKEDVDSAAETILEYESKDGKFVHRARPGAYGGTKDEKHAVDTLSGPKEKDLKNIEKDSTMYKKGYHATSKNYLRKDTQDYFSKRFSENLDLYKEQGLKGLFEALKKKEVMVEEPTSAEFDAQLADAKQRAAGTKKQPEISKPAVQAVQNEETHTTVEFIDYNDVNGVKISEIDLAERQMTEPEMKKKEQIVKSMKKGISGFKERYGKDAKSVMYATATKQAMKSESIEQIEEASDAHQAGYNYTQETIEDAQSKAEIHRHHRAIQADNPHSKGSQEHKDWTAGTDKAKDDHLKDWS